MSVQAFVSGVSSPPDDVHVQALHGKIDCNDVLTRRHRAGPRAENCDGGRYRFDGPVVRNRGGAFDYNVRTAQRPLTAVVEPGIVGVA